MKTDIVDRALAAERDRKGFSTEQREALWKGIEGALGPAAGAPAPPEAPQGPEPERAPPPAPPASSVGTAAVLSVPTVAALIAAAALGGIGAGALAHARWTEPLTAIAPPSLAPTTTVTTPAPPPSSPTPPLAITSATGSPNRAAPVVAPPVIAAPVAAPPPSTAPVAAKDPALARERHLLDMARTALSRGEASAALMTLDTHAREFPSSRLAEEREVLAVQALASANRMPEARARASAFKVAYPNSALAPIVEEAAR